MITFYVLYHVYQLNIELMFSDLKLYNNPDVKKRTRVAIIKFKDKRRAESAVDCLTGSILKDQQIFLELEEVGGSKVCVLKVGS